MYGTCISDSNGVYYQKGGDSVRYQVRNAIVTDMEAVKTLYEKAREFMEQHGNPNQWGKTYPSDSQIAQDIVEEKLYVLWDACGIHGVFYFSTDPDPTYEVIENGRWSSNQAYGVIHRVAGDGSGGILQEILTYARRFMHYLRIDTHENNYVMQRALIKNGFIRCGTIYAEDGTERIAYDSFSGVREARMEDLQKLLQLYLHLHENTIPEQSEKLESAWRKIINDPNHHLIVYEKNREIVSSCVCVIIPNLTRSIQPYAFVENVVTHADHRRQGLAAACLAYAKQIAVKEGCYKMMLLTGSKEEETLAFYRKAGYNSEDKTAFIQWLK